MKKKLFSIYILLLVFSTELIHAQCLEVTSIFVNACQGQANEGDNEMFSFTVGASPLAIADITVNWGTSNSFDGWCFNSVSTAALNANISNNCGFFIEPISGILPANADVLVVTSEFFSLIDNDFSNLSDTLYILYQCGSTAPGHFSNSANNTLTVTTTNSCIGVESVSYLASSLVGGDGATVLYDAAGNGTYVNNGCNAPIVTFSVGWSFTNAICNTYGVVDLNNLLSGNATTGGTWSGPRVSGSTYNPNGYLGLDSITYSINGSGSCLASSDSTIVFNVVQTNTASYNTQSCDSVYYNGIWYTSSATFVDTISGTGYACDSFTNVTISIQNAIIDSTYLSSCTSLTFNGNTYSSSTILRDTITGGGGSSSSCSELFFSEYIEGSSNNKALEIYNGTGVPVNLANYSIERYTNGSTTASLPILTLSGTLADGDVYVIYNSLATNTTLLAQGDLATGYINHNGDDAYALVHNTTIVDVFGNIGCDPGNEWTDLGNGTQDNGYYRLPNYTAGANDPANTPCNIPSLIATNWVSTDALDDFSNIGSHNANCGSSSSSTCDSIFITNIDIASPATTNTITACTNNPALAGTVNDTIFNINGCDSIITTTITTLVTPSTIPVNLSGCGSVSYNSVNYSTSTSFSDTTLSSLGCDSVYTNVNIVVNQNASSQNPGNPFLICDTNDSIQLPGGAYAYGAGTFNFTIPNGAANGCDSTVTTIVQTQSCGCFFDDISKTFWIKADTLLQNAGLPVNSGTATLWGNIVSNPLVPDLNSPVGAGTRTIIQNDQSFNFNSSMDFVNAGFLRGGLPNNAILDPNQGSMFVVASQASLSFAFVVGTAATGVCGGNRCSSGFRNNRSEYGSENNLYTGTTNTNVANVMALTANVNTSFQKNSLNGVVGTSNLAGNIPVSNASVNYSTCIGNWPGFNMTGKVAEAIAFNRELTTDEYERVESYLAVKYGTGLSHNYYASDYNGTTGTITFFYGLGYDNNIAGIGRDDCFSLEQTKSHSVAPGAIVTMALTDNGGSYNNPNAFNNNLEFLLWGNNGGSTSFSCSANTPAGFSSLYNRVWIAQQSGLVGTTSIAFDITAANLTGSASDYALVVDTDGDGLYSDETPIIGSIIANELVFDNVDLANQTFTLVQNTAVSTTVNDQICNNATYTLPGGTIVSQAGTYIDTLQTAQLCDSIVTTVLIPIICSCEFDLGPDTAFCAGGSLTLDAGAGFDSYTWQDNSNGQTFTASSTGTYYCTTTFLDLNNNLVVNGDFEQGDTGFTTDYGPGVGGAFGLLTNAGTYAVNTSPSNVHNNFFSCSDHTSGTGNMMIVNGSNTPNTNVWCQNITVNPNTDYLFSAWAMSLENTNFSNVATLHFLINGTQFGPNFSPSYTACDWQQFSTTWNSGSNINIQICIESDVIAGNNDYAIDDIFFTPSCNYTDTINVTVNPIPTPDLGPDQSICQGGTVSFDATSPNATYLWQDGTTTSPSFTTSTAGLYWVDVTVNSCTGRDSVNLAINPILTTNLNENICAGDSLFLANAWQNTSGIYYDTLVSAALCDSIIATTLNVQQVQIEATVQNLVCENELPALIFGNNQSTAGIYFDTLSSTLGCDSLIRSIELVINLTSSDTSFVSICEGESYELNGQFLSTAGIFASDTSTNTSACDQYNFVNLSVNPLPTAFLGADTTINEGDLLELFVLNSNNTDDYTWLNSIGESYQGSSIIANNTESAFYFLSAESNFNCFAYDTLEVFVNPLAETSLFIPTAFSPNGDSYNDVFRIANFEDFESYSLRIYNRWGELIFDNKGYNVSWDGSYKGIKQNIGVYVYYIEATSLNGELLRASGNVSLIR